MSRLVLLIAAFLLIVPAGASAAAFDKTITAKDIRKAYREAQKGEDKLKILIVPGHDNEFSGTAFGGLREADINVTLATKIKELLDEDENVEVRLARTATGYDEELWRFFLDRRDYVQDFIASRKEKMERFMEEGKIDAHSGVAHNAAASEAAHRLYSINKWASDQDYAIVLHVHFNDIARYNPGYPGPYTGFAVYVPERQFGNARASYEVGEALRDSLLSIHYPSTLPGESGGLIEDQELIAIGAYNTSKAASVLVEYAYIYENRIQNLAQRPHTLSAMAEATREALQDFLSE